MSEETKKFAPAGGDGAADGGLNASLDQMENDAGGGASEREDDMQMLRPQNDTLLPMKRSQATKSPVAPEALSAESSQAAATSAAAPMGLTVAAVAGPASPRKNYHATPHEMKKTNILSHMMQNDQVDDEDEMQLKRPSALRGPRASLNASFDAAAASNLNQPNMQHQQTGAGTGAEVASGRSSNDNPKYTSPKRRKHSFDQQSSMSPLTLAQKPPPPPPAQQLPAASQSFTPLRPPKTQQKRYRRGSSTEAGGVSSILFSPKPVYSGEKRGRLKRPPRPSALAPGSTVGSAASIGGGAGSGFNSTGAPVGGGPGTPSSPLTPSPKNAAQTQNNMSGSSSQDSSHSPATPFRFHAFPASLPRVNSRGGGGNGVGMMGGDIAACDTVDSSSGRNFLPGSTVPGSTTRLSLQPKPSSMASSALRNNPQLQQIPPPSPATRRLFMRSSDPGPASDVQTHRLTLNPSFDVDNHDQADISGDWSESTSIRSATNERIRMSNVPSHVMSHSRSAALNDLEEEVDTVVGMEEDDDLDNDLDQEGGCRKLRPGHEDDDIVQKESSESALSGTKLNFNSPPPLPETEEPLSGGVNSTLSSSSGKKQNHESLESTIHPHTPRGLSAGDQFHIHNLEVSPIVRSPNDDEYDGDIPMKGSLDEDEPQSKAVENGVGGNRGSLIQPLFRNAPSPILPNKSTLMQQTNEECVNTSENSGALFSTTSGNSSSAVDTTASTANVNNTTLNSTLSKPTAIRKLRRPMPDTSAFDVGTPSAQQSSFGQTSFGSKDSGFHSHKTTAAGTHSSDNTHHRTLLCPPTPIRTPAWAHDSHHPGIGPLKRANSLITTKVLAACPQPVLDNLSSLEDSMMENDISGSTMDSTAEQGSAADGSLHNPASSFAPVMEDEDAGDGNEGSEEMGGTGTNACMFRSLEDGSPASLRNNDPQERREGTNMILKQGNDAHYGSWKTPRSSVEEEETVTFSDFDNLGILGSGAFADVYKVRSKKDRKFYAIKRTRRQFRGVKDRERAMAEVHTMKRLQNALLSEAAAAAAAASSSASTSQSKGHAEGSGHHSKSNYGLYLLFFIRAWQEDGFFYCQTELCSRATCRHLWLSLSTDWERDVVRYPSLELCLTGGVSNEVVQMGEESEQDTSVVAPQHSDQRLIPERAIWQICHDISRGLFHIHSYGMVHYDIKPSNIFFVFNSKWGGTICKIGDFGLAGDVGTKDDGQEGDTVYMPDELLLSSCAKHPGADIFSLGLALYELSASPSWSLPREGDRWHEIRSGVHGHPKLPLVRSDSLFKLIRAMIQPNVKDRPSAEDISEMIEVKRANALSDSFLSRYINDVEKYDSRREREMETAEEEARRRSSTPIASMFNHHAIGSDTVSRAPPRDMRTPTNTNEDPPALFH
mmetsp:Transcript_38242/g.80460  ORF Transcript_38242/g.80460 Transcript_38242/m.80460 type:complete len:1393 (+) Transcript_38242:345-4523(+)